MPILILLLDLPRHRLQLPVLLTLLLQLLLLLLQLLLLLLPVLLLDLLLDLPVLQGRRGGRELGGARRQLQQRMHLGWKGRRDTSRRRSRMIPTVQASLHFITGSQLKSTVWGSAEIGKSKSL